VLRRLIAAVAVVGASSLLPLSAAAAAPEPQPRSPLLDIPEGCPTQIFDDTVVFVGTVTDSDYRTVRFRIDQPRAGDLGRFASQVGDRYLVDVRYGVDAKYLHHGAQYLVGATADPNAGGMLASKVAPVRDPIGGNEVINADETDLHCPSLGDPKMTVHIDGSAVDSGMLTPLLDDRRGVLGAVFTAAGVVLGGIAVLALLRWILTGFGRGVSPSRRSQQRDRAVPAARPVSGRR